MFVFLLNFLVEKVENIRWIFINIRLLTFQQKNVDQLEFIFDVMSLIVAAILGSVLIRSS